MLSLILYTIAAGLTTVGVLLAWSEWCDRVAAKKWRRIEAQFEMQTSGIRCRKKKGKIA